MTSQVPPLQMCFYQYLTHWWYSCNITKSELQAGVSGQYFGNSGIVSVHAKATHINHSTLTFNLQLPFLCLIYFHTEDIGAILIGINVQNLEHFGTSRKICA